ncbi:MAG TPA: T9SS type A sorting domain-containing protein, partial [Bacteroidia bacterium]|nr:T9SS type A sorting domain-containing protein [Bacteroidia bacterium]
QWQVDPGSGFVNLSNVAPYSGVNTNTLTINPTSFAMTGYSYRCVMNGSCTATQNSSAAILTVNLCTGIIDPSQGKVSIFPNPSNGIFKLKNFPAGSSIEIFNMLGEQIYSADNIGADAEINLENFATGIFLYRISVDGRVIQNGRLVKTN